MTPAEIEDKMIEIEERIAIMMFEGGLTEEDATRRVIGDSLSLTD